LRTPEAYLMLLPAALIDAVAACLRKFVLRSRVQLAAASGLHTIGIAGPDAAGVLGRTIGEPPRHALEQVQYPGLTLTRLPGRGFLLTAAVEKLAEVWPILAGYAMPAGTAAWDWAGIQSGVAWITPGTQELFLPQMIGLDAIGGVSFQKGCYPGQEIVARTHYLGEVKRQLYSGHCDAPAQAADALVEETGQVRGSIVNAAPAPGGGSDFLAVVTQDAGTGLRLGHADGPRVRLNPHPVHDVSVPDRIGSG
jgi:tRNA-modifying protein YgfZ